MTDATAQPDRLHELLADEALYGLSSEDQAELSRLLEASPGTDPDGLALIAAAMDLAMVADVDPLPSEVREHVETGAVQWLAEQRGLSMVAAPTAAVATGGRAPGQTSWVPWLAAAAGLFLAVLAWWPTDSTDPQPDPPPAVAELTAEEKRDRLLAEGPDVVELPWGMTDAIAGVTGTVVWSNERQEGYMTLSGLAINDPTTMQYQLWIFDARRPEQLNAVDGGVFDVTETGEVIVPINSKLEVFEPALFAITTEPPGGVIKHETRDDFKIILTAPVA